MIQCIALIAGVSLVLNHKLPRSIVKDLRAGPRDEIGLIMCGKGVIVHGNTLLTSRMAACR